MSTRVQVVLSEVELERFRRQAAAEHLSLSAWFRRLGHDRLDNVEPPRLRTREDFDKFFASLAAEPGAEPEWDVHRRVIEESRMAGLPET